MLSDHSRRKTLRCIFEALDKTQAKWVVLHDLEDNINSDVDMLLEAGPAQIPRLLHDLLPPTLRVVQVLSHEHGAHYCVVAYRHESGSHLVPLDISYDYRRDGRVFFGGDKLLGSRVRQGNMWALEPHMEFSYYLVKKIAKGTLSTEQAQKLSRLYAQDPAACRDELNHFFSKSTATLIDVCAQGSEWTPVQTKLDGLRRELLSRSFSRNPLAVMVYWYHDLLRRIKRVTRPTGLMVTFLGPDGAGKTTIIKGIEEGLGTAFRHTRRFHLRPRMFGRFRHEVNEVTNPHAAQQRGLLASIAKVVFWGLDYTFGYLTRIRPLLIRSSLVCFDRYYHDLMVDPHRYRYGGPQWFVKLIGRIIPKPDLVILLDVPPDVLQQRKREVTPEESARQRDAYRKLVENNSRGIIVDASMPVDEVISTVSAVLLDHMEDRVARRLTK